MGGRVTLKNNLEACFPNIAKYWHPSKNGNITPSDITPRNGNKYWWICDKGHEFKSKTSTQTATGNIRCSVCRGFQVTTETCLATIRPDLSSEWDSIKNVPLTTYNVPVNSTKKVWWLCPVGHSYDMTITKRQNGRNCPYCSGKRVGTENSLATLRPDLAQQWHPTKNGAYHPSDFTIGSSKKVWWLCENGHEFDCSIVSRTKRNIGCRYCKNQQVCKETCLATINPELAKQWHPTLNGKLTPKDVFPNTSKKVYWICDYEHVTFSSINHRNNGVSCAECNKGCQTSFPEQAIFFYLSSVFPDAINRYKMIFESKTIEVDIFLPCINLAIEYDGYYHHDLSAKDEQKCRVLREYGVNLIRVRSNTLPMIQAYGALILNHVKNNIESLTSCIEGIFKYITENFHTQKYKSIQLIEFPSVDIQRDELQIYQNKMILNIKKSIASTHRYLTKEWDFELNGSIKPEHVTAGVSTKVWWKCDKGHPSYKMAVNKRTSGSGCNVCAGKVVAPETCLLSTHPLLCTEWNSELNTGITPLNVSHGSERVVWWNCENGHQYKASICSRTGRGQGCSYCNGQAVNDENCLATLFPKLLEEWDYEKNDSLLPTNVRAQSNKVVYWKCAKGHSWKVVISSRSGGGSCCPYCKGLLPTEETCLATINSKLASEWNHEKNGELTPENVMPKSGKRVWWICSNGHTWEATIASRSNGSGCPYCRGRKVCEDNSLESVEPELSKEWHPTKNGDLTPNDVTRSSRKKVWWFCRNCQREWEAFVYSRSKNGVCKCGGNNRRT